MESHGLLLAVHPMPPYPTEAVDFPQGSLLFLSPVFPIHHTACHIQVTHDLPVFLIIGLGSLLKHRDQFFHSSLSYPSGLSLFFHQLSPYLFLPGVLYFPGFFTGFPPRNTSRTGGFSFSVFFQKLQLRPLISLKPPTGRSPRQIFMILTLFRVTTLISQILAHSPYLPVQSLGQDNGKMISPLFSHSAFSGNGSQDRYSPAHPGDKPVCNRLIYRDFIFLFVKISAFIIPLPGLPVSEK